MLPAGRELEKWISHWPYAGGMASLADILEQISALPVEAVAHTSRR